MIQNLEQDRGIFGHPKELGELGPLSLHGPQDLRPQHLERLDVDVDIRDPRHRGAGTPEAGKGLPCL